MREADVKQRMQAALDHLQSEMASVRTGRANAALVESVSVACYGQEMPLKSLANITTPDAKTISIAPWDPSVVGAIEKALHDDPNLDLNPQSDGKVIYINVPPLTEERREQLVKQVGQLGEQAHISLRNVRRDELKSLQLQQKDKSISEDEFERSKKRLDELVSEYGQEVDEAVAQKQSEVRSV